MERRVTDGPQDEYRRQLEDVHRRSDWEHGPASRPDPDWEHASAARPDPGGSCRPDPDWEAADDPIAAVRDLFGALLRRPRRR
jgi:hypothetical protein